MKTALTLCAFTLIMAGCASYGTGTGSSQEADYGQLVAQAENEIKVAEKTGFLWNNTEKFLKESKEAKIEADNARKSGACSQCQHGVDALGIRADVL